MSAPKSSRAYGKPWGDTTVPNGQTKAEIDKVVRKWDRFAKIQWTETHEALMLRFQSQGANYVFLMRQYEDDPHENRRTVRAVLWYLKGLLGLESESDDLLYPERALLPYREFAPNVTFGDALKDEASQATILSALGGGQLALTEGER
jgi:hypothetical protein